MDNQRQSHQPYFIIRIKLEFGSKIRSSFFKYHSCPPPNFGRRENVLEVEE